MITSRKGHVQALVLQTAKYVGEVVGEVERRTGLSLSDLFISLSGLSDLG
jgi:cell division ATPase FtsA